MVHPYIEGGDLGEHTISEISNEKLFFLDLYAVHNDRLTEFNVHPLFGLMQM